MATEHVEELGGQAVETLRAFLSDTEPDKTDIVKAKIAVTVFASVVRLKQTQGAQDALSWSMATTLLDKDRLQEYVRVSMPNVPLVKALDSGAPKLKAT